VPCPSYFRSTNSSIFDSGKERKREKREKKQTRNSQ
jgi:hypothetical protein